jgi:ADP-ribose pyrophosphatase YjhB (NUDIX family)
MQEYDGSLILITYKGKILLTIDTPTPFRSKNDIWTFIEGQKKGNESFEKAIRRKIESMLCLNPGQIELLSHWTYNSRKKYFFHAQLTDEEVNSMQRLEGETIDFFSVRELEKLQMSHLTKLFIQKHRELLEKTSHPSLQSMNLS